ncbi:MAG: histidine phosphatase family protein [bacterium]
MKRIEVIFVKTIEVRRHSIRGKGKGLSREGVELAKSARPTLSPPYDIRISSPKKRARETMEAFGFENYSTDERFSTLDDSRIEGFEDRIEMTAASEGCSKFEALFRVPEVSAILRKMGEGYLSALRDVAAKLPEGGKALIVSHGGSIEPAALLGFPRYDLAEMGGPLEPCEGVVFHFEGEKLQKVEVIRLPGR